MSDKFTINYYYMGQGDCILIECPDGRLVMIDCGSSKGLGANNEDLLVKVCTDIREITKNNGNKIDILILTHSDKDHYNQIIQIFSDRTIIQDDDTPKKIGVVNIGRVYFSSLPNAVARFALHEFDQAGCGNSIINSDYNTGSVRQVFINAADKKMVTYTKNKSFKLSHGTEKTINKQHTLLKGTTTGTNQPWTVSLIAGHVPETDPKVKDKINALSLVTLLQVGKSKGLFLGDATRSTEAFLMKSQRSLITNVDFVHIPHHGSETSSGVAFVKAVNPTGAEVTHETDETGFKLPKEDVLQRWLDVLKGKDTTDDHAIDYWKTITKSIFDKTYEAWKKNKYPFTVHGSGYYLLSIPKNYKNNYIYLYRTTNYYWGLYRAQTALNLWGTGATGFVQWTLPL